MNKYRIHLVLKSGRITFSDPLNVSEENDKEEIAEMMEDIVNSVTEGAAISFEVSGLKKTYLNHAIESIYWTDGS